MNKKTITITIIVVAVLILVIAATLYYSISNIAYYNQNGQLAAVATNGYGGGAVTETVTEAFNVALLKEMDSIVPYKVYDKYISAKNSVDQIQQTEDLIGEQLPAAYLKNGRQETYYGSLVMKADGNYDRTPIIENGQKVGYTYKVRVSSCKVVTQYTRSNSVNVYGAVPDLQLKSWVTDWNSLVDYELKLRGITNRNNNLPGIYYGARDWGDISHHTAINSPVYSLGGLNTCLDRYIHNDARITNVNQAKAFVNHYFEVLGLKLSDKYNGPLSEYERKRMALSDKLEISPYVINQEIVYNDPNISASDAERRRNLLNKKLYEAMDNGGNWLIANDFALQPRAKTIVVTGKTTLTVPSYRVSTLSPYYYDFSFLEKRYGRSLYDSMTPTALEKEFNLTPAKF